MKILVIGDPHGSEKVKKIPLKKVDVILLTGDLGKADLARKRFFENIERKRKGLPELEDTPAHLRSLYMEIHKSTIDLLKYLSKHAPVYTIQGNVGVASFTDVKKEKKKHGIKIYSTRNQIDSMSNVDLVKNRLRLLDGKRIGFLEYYIDNAWVREFKPTDYSKKFKEAKKESAKARGILKRFGKVDVLVCHQPPYGILDKVGAPAPKQWRGKHAGGKEILNYIKKHQPRYVFCGHIHEGEGHKKIGKTDIYNLGVAGYKIIEI